ncbi:hypothetical protein PIB30_034662 [Stylosanthes scabra]|uniref:Uncharacterized protein n=1 Tax=Stylosanthes scabra TaxID=79078 RepID=A0ABU6QCZ8_9FABA|nr:hypothetical protein [Stylosanthes scabra]
MEKKEYEEELKDSLLKNEDVECLHHEEVVECEEEIEMTSKINIEEASKIKLYMEDHVTLLLLQDNDPPMGISHDLEENLEEFDKQQVKDDDQEFKVDDEEKRGMEIALITPCGVFPPKSPSQLQFECINHSTINFLGLYQYALLEMDGQFRALCRLKSEDELNVGWKQKPKLKNERISRLEVQRWCKAKLIGFQTRNWSSEKHLESWPLQKNHEDQQESGWSHKVQDPEKHFNNQQFWRALDCCSKSFLSLVQINLNPMKHIKFKHWCGFKDEFKHKPP